MEDRFSPRGGRARGIVPLLEPEVFPGGCEWRTLLQTSGFVQRFVEKREGVPQGAVSGPPTSSEGSLKNSFQFWDDVEIPGG